MILRVLLWELLQSDPFTSQKKDLFSATVLTTTNPVFVVFLPVE
jgi:hypothetical protein